MHWFTGLFVLLLLSSSAWRSWLNQRQVAAVLGHRDRVPEAFADQIDLAAHQKAADYTVAGAKVNRWDVLLDAVVALILTLGGGIDLIDRWWQAAGLSPDWHGTAVVLATLLVAGAIGLPLSLWRTFAIEARFGFNRTTPALYVADLFKSLLLSLLLGGPLIFVVLYLMRQAGPLWWLYAWLVWVGFTVLITWAWPTLFAPLFNKFTPSATQHSSNAPKRCCSAVASRPRACS